MKENVNCSKVFGLKTNPQIYTEKPQQTYLCKKDDG